MSENTMVALIVCCIIASCTAAGIADKYVEVHKPPKVEHPMTPDVACVKAAWTQADRIECINAAKGITK